jgi:RIO kinase 1
MILFKLINRGLLNEINGCISTGKEANVYHALSDDHAHTNVAIKIYKTSILVFKDRDRYVTGDSRFSRYAKHNPRKMVKMWAEKEMRNLKRLYSAGINCPEPLYLKLHVLVMSFLGNKNGWYTLMEMKLINRAYPRLKDAITEDDVYPLLYNQVLKDMRIMYQTCRLVHADLSEFNLLFGSPHEKANVRYNDKKVYVIDVSQSVEHDHPRSLEFLRMDIKNVTDFFRKKGVATLQERTAFEFITADNTPVDRDGMEGVLTEMIKDDEKKPVQEEVDERVFRQAYIPKSLFEVVDPERDVGIVQQGGKDDLIYAKLLDVQETQAQSAERPDPQNGELAKDEEGDDTESTDSKDSSEEDSSKPRGKRHEDKEAKKVVHLAII